MSSVSSALVSQQISILAFNGQSKYSAQFQTILQKAVQSDTIRLSGLDDAQNVAQGRLSALQGIDQGLTALQSAVTALQTAVGPTALSGSVANPTLASVSVGLGATAGSYQLEVDDLGAATQTISSSSNTRVTDPNTQNIDSNTSFTLGVTDPAQNGGATQYTTISNPQGTLAGLVQAINAQPGLDVSASIVNVGSQGSPDYRLSLQSTSLGAVGITLGAGTNSSAPNLLTTMSTGRNSSYKVDGTAISGTSDTVELAPGVNVQLQQTAVGSPTTVTVSQSTSQSQTALSQFASAYNQVVDLLSAQHGKSAGALAGDSILQTIQHVLTNVQGYTSGSQNASDLGLDLDAQGHLTFNAAEFQMNVGSNFSQLSQFLGNSTTGFIGNATSALASLQDANNGIVKTTEKDLTSSVATLQTQINDQIDQVNQFQQTLYDQLAQTDAMVYSLNSQQSFFQQLFQQMTANLMGGG